MCIFCVCVCYRSALKSAVKSVLCLTVLTAAMDPAAITHVWWESYRFLNAFLDIDNVFFSMFVVVAHLTQLIRCVSLSLFVSVLSARFLVPLCSKWLWYFRDMLRRLRAGQWHISTTSNTYDGLIIHVFIESFFMCVCSALQTYTSRTVTSALSTRYKQQKYNRDSANILWKK